MLFRHIFFSSLKPMKLNSIVKPYIPNENFADYIEILGSFVRISKVKIVSIIIVAISILYREARVCLKEKS